MIITSTTLIISVLKTTIKLTHLILFIINIMISKDILQTNFLRQNKEEVIYESLRIVYLISNHFSVEIWRRFQLGILGDEIVV